MSDKTIADSGAAETEATTNIGELLDTDGLANQLERLLDSEPEEAPASQEENANEELPPDEGESSDPLEDEESAEETALSQNEDEPAEAEPALDADEDDVEEQAEGDNPNKGLLKRIDKLTAKRREAEGKVDSLESEVAKLRAELDANEQLPTVPASDASNPYSHLNSVQSVEKELDQAEEVLEWCEDNADGAVVKNSKGEEIEYSAEDIRGVKKNARKALKRHLPKRLEYLKEESDVAGQVEEVFPYWKDKSSQSYQEAMQILRNRPDLRNHPTWKADVSMFLLGLQSYREMVNNTGAKKAAKKGVKAAPKQPAAPAAAPAQKSPTKARSASARKNFGSDSSVETLANILESDYV